MSWALSPRFLTVLLYTGFHNLELGAKHRFLVNAEHEAILSLGGRAEIGGTDSKAIGTDRFSTIVPSFFSGKGFGVLPDFVRILRPLALTGQVGDSFPTRSNVEEKQASPQTWNGDFRWGRALFICKASERYRIAGPFDRLIPAVKFPMETPLNPGGTPATGTINPGVIWSGKYFQIGLEAVIPINRHTGNNVGVLAQLHFYLDDLFSQIFGKSFSEGERRFYTDSSDSAERKSVSPKSRTASAQAHYMHKRLMVRQKQWAIKVGTQSVQETLS